MTDYRSSEVRALLRDALARSERFASFVRDPQTAESPSGAAWRPENFEFEAPGPDGFDFEAPAEAEVPRRLRELAKLFEDRHQLYGDNYMMFGDVMAALFPTGIEADTEHDWNRLGLLTEMVYKFTRYVAMFHRGGHPDSLDDLAVYTVMLREIDRIVDN